MRLANLMKYAVIIITTVPIMCVYPFVQKYFSQGVMIGAIKDESLPYVTLPLPHALRLKSQNIQLQGDVNMRNKWTRVGKALLCLTLAASMLAAAAEAAEAAAPAGLRKALEAERPPPPARRPLRTKTSMRPAFPSSTSR